MQALSDLHHRFLKVQTWMNKRTLDREARKEREGFKSLRVLL